MGFPLHRIGVLLIITSALPLFADSESGDFQRAVEHDRAFQREMDAQRDRTNASNQPSTFKAPPSQAVSAQAWLNALDEQKRRAAEANAARGREYDLRGLRAAEAARKEQAEKVAQSAKYAASEATVAIAARPLIQLGIVESEALAIARFLPVYDSGAYHIDSSPAVREAIAQAAQAKASFDALAATASYDELADLATRMDTGRSGSPLIYGAWKMSLFCLPYTSLQARVKLLDRFKNARAATDLAIVCEQWRDSSRLWRLTPDERNQTVAIMARAACAAGRGERELAALLTDSKSDGHFHNHPDLVAQLYTAAYARSIAELSRGTTDLVARKAAAEAAFDDTEAMIAFYMAEAKWPEVLEWHVRAFELPGFSVNLSAQAAFRLLITSKPELIETLSPAQWTRLAAANNLAVPELLEELPRHLDPATQPNLLRNVRLSRAAQSDDRVAALSIAYECRRAADGWVEDSVGFFRSLAVAGAVAPAVLPPEQMRAVHQARAFSAIVFTNWTDAQRLSAIADGVSAGVRECVYAAGLVQRMTAKTAADYAKARELFSSLGSEPVWNGKVFALSALAQLAESWSNDRTVPDGAARAEAIRRTGAEAGDVSCMAMLGVQLTGGSSTKATWPEGRSWLDRAAEAGEPSASAQKGFLLASGRAGYPADLAGAVPFLKRGSPIDHNAVYYYLGFAFKRGKGVEQDAAMALRYWESVKGNYADEAAIEIADAYALGVGTAQDTVKAVAVIRPFAEAGHAAAQNVLGTFISKKYVPGVAPEEAFPWWRKAAAQKLFIAARNIYTSRMRGVPGPAEPDAALQELEEFLTGAMANVQYQGGLLLLHEGPLTFKENTRNDTRGRYWIEAAARAGYAPATAWLKKSPVTE